MAMHIDLILKPWTRDDADGKLFLWMDNCGPHKTDCLHSVFNEANVEVGLLPPNMTSELQVLDLVVNGPIKAHIRKLRAQRICKYFDKYRGIFRDQRKLRVTQLPKWDPPKSLDYTKLELDEDDIVDIIVSDGNDEEFEDDDEEYDEED
jgi:hypothetical protein